MKKIVLICLGLMVSATLFAQKNKDGEMRGDVLYLNNGVMIKKGSKLMINGPLGDDSRFKYVHHAPDNLFEDITVTLNNPAEPYYAAKEVTVRKVRYVGKKSDTDGQWIIRLRNIDKVDFLCDIVPALQTGEVSAMQVTTVVPQTPPTQATPTTSVVTTTPQPESKTTNPSISVADELLKLKKLMDEGIITKEEFEVQKKKLLDM